MHARLMCLLRGFVRCLLRREGSSLARTTKATRTSRRLRDQVPFKIRDRDHRVIERRCDMHDAVGNVLLLFLTKDLLFSACFSHKLFPLADFRLPILFSVHHKSAIGNWQSTMIYFLPGAFFLAMVARR